MTVYPHSNGQTSQQDIREQAAGQGSGQTPPSRKTPPAQKTPFAQKTPLTRSSLRIRVSIAALILFGIAGLVVAVLVSGEDDTDGTATPSPAVDRVIPAAGDEVLQQQQVGVVLDPRYRLSSLVIYPSSGAGGAVDVTGEVVHVEGLNRFEFNPGAGRLVEALSPDINCAVATFVLIARPEEADTVRWCFTVS